MVPESENPEAFATKNPVANRIMGGLFIGAVMAPVDLNDQSVGQAGEVQIVAAERNLSPDMETLRPKAFQA